MHSYRHQGFRIANRNRAIGLENLHYTSKFFELASRAGEELGLEKGVNYTAVQWRSETVGLYKACADFLLNQSWSTTPEAPSHLLLVSDIAVDPKRLLWHNMKHHAVNTSDQQDALTAFFQARLPQGRSALGSARSGHRRHRHHRQDSFHSSQALRDLRRCQVEHLQSMHADEVLFLTRDP
eukprot:gnl/TRDRNA2_/TRDRNA2_177913_c5_seq16.p1 gnl/TRDRNA2_/TRDRNA2_177913_c5~~gnl/TRDRNA2_/TRDRNA2_177913_c5_seq16.p1  ORF type:complete len:181 (-),score=13.87 gnl/TRDRNA2_/TRDRNA2_177913_c5_seq16:341-883(-)